MVFENRLKHDSVCGLHLLSINRAGTDFSPPGLIRAMKPTPNISLCSLHLPYLQLIIRTSYALYLGTVLLHIPGMS